MFAEESNHFDIVSRSLNGLRDIDEQTHASLAVLTERLETLKKTSSLFAGVRFSSDIGKLAAHRVPVG
jgi:hypothetical protein